MVDKKPTRKCNACNLVNNENAKYCRKCGMELTGFGTAVRDMTRSGANITKSILFNVTTAYAAFNLFSVLICLAVAILGFSLVQFELQAFVHLINLVSFQKGAVDVLLKNPLEIIVLSIDIIVGSVAAILIPGSILTKLGAFVGLLIPSPDPVTKGTGIGATATSIVIDVIIAICMLILAIFATAIVLFFSLVAAAVINLLMVFVVFKTKKVPLLTFFYGFFCIFVSIILFLNTKYLLLPSFLPLIIILFIFISGFTFIVVYILQILHFFGIRTLDNIITQCPDCNSTLTANLNNCTYCGKTIFANCKVCGEKYNNELNFCPKCGVENINNNQFCIICGKKNSKSDICKDCTKKDKNMTTPPS